ncbi:zinc finger protein Pegasus-like isoform X4 [Conger conger]|uniref:zinc finger protein Pegasus-like isoform X4 n=2 Tax=Conger conger TaxID=82655 RepID=UPI002A5AD2C9|nr:zinc finger protein Pegasus-like isoform X4 [Conger conger]
MLFSITCERNYVPGLQSDPPGMQAEPGDGCVADGTGVGHRPMFCLPAAGTETDQNRLDHASVEVSLDDGSGLLVDSFERTYDGKLKCRYCNYASKGTARLIEHIRIHTGEKPHRCHLCPFASAYERHLEAHMRSHTGEKPYKCELCSFRCSDRSNLSHHRRRRHKLLPMKGARSALAGRKMLGVLQRKSGSLGYGRRLLLGYGPPSAAGPKADYLGHFPPDLPQLHPEPRDGGGGDASRLDAVSDNPLTQLSTLAGQLASLPADARAPVSPETGSCRDEKPFLLCQPAAAPVSAGSAQAASPASPEPRPPPASNYSPGAGPCSEQSAHTSTPSVSNSQPSTPAPALSSQDLQLLQHCQHCDTYFADNILYTIHMGCHGYENPFQCNICGCKCRNKYDFACHFARGQHK